MDFRFHTLDVFTDRVFGGNPLAVYPDGRGLDTETMQRIAREMNLSETVFLLPPEGSGTKRVRIFTPARELPFAGHPTVGTAWFLAGSGDVPVERDGISTLVLEENIGPVAVEVTMKRGRPEFARFTAAQRPEYRTPAFGRAECARLLSLSEDEIGAPGWEIEMVSCGLPFLVVPVRDLDAIGRSRLDLTVWDELLEGGWTRMVYPIAPAAKGSGADVRVRMYGPHAGVPEDPATGSAAAALAAYLGKRGARDGPDGTLRWRIAQGVEMGRPSLIEAEADVQGGAVIAVRVGGRAVAVSRGTLTLPEPD
jgi:trans-2,3-dihydro-3-hydroxyanthranilate isomerase